MLEGKRQKQVAAVIQKDLNDIFQKLGLNMIQWISGTIAM